MTASENQIVVYQPNETVRLDVRLENETVWLTQSQMAMLFGCSTDNIGLHLKNVYAVGELSREATTEDFSVVRMEGARQVRRTVTCYNLDAIISVGYRVNSVLGVKFRQWATGVLKDYLLRGYAVNQRLNQLEDKMDRRLAKHDDDIADLKDKVDFFVQTKEPPLQGVFYDGQLWDARALVLKLIGSAKRSLILIDNWATPEVLDLFTKKRAGVKVTIFTSEHYDKNHVPRHKKRRFSATFEREVSVPELAEMGYPRSEAKPHADRYLLFRVAPLEDDGFQRRGAKAQRLNGGGARRLAEPHGRAVAPRPPPPPTNHPPHKIFVRAFTLPADLLYLFPSC